MLLKILVDVTFQIETNFMLTTATVQYFKDWGGVKGLEIPLPQEDSTHLFYKLISHLIFTD